MPHYRLTPFVFLYVLAAGVFAAPVADANICDAAAHRAAQQTTVPAEVLLTITRLETGRSAANGAPWPWTVNHAGDGTWFQSEDDARSYVFSKVKAGATNLDIGCFQINYRWHSDAFRSLDEMFNPEKNALYAAGFLERLHAEFGDWTEAAGAYHSRTPKFATRYKAKFRDISTTASFPAAGADPQTADRGIADGPTPLIALDDRPASASLFPSSDADVTPLFDLGGSN